MKVEELRARRDKAQDNVEKRLKTIERHKAQLVKLQAKLQECDWVNVDDLKSIQWDEAARAKYKAETGRDLYWDICDYNSKQGDITDSYKKLKELEQIVDNWNEKLSKAEAVEDIWNGVIPESFKSYKAKLVAEWNDWDKKRRATLKAQYDSLGYKEFMRTYKYAGYSFMHLTDDEIDKENQRDAENLILDLYQRVVKYVGKVTSWDSLWIQQYHINGYITGELGNCKVESILAGGYNIQRLHVRVLVHKYDKPIPSAEDSKQEAEQAAGVAPVKEEVKKEKKVAQSTSEYSQMTISELEELVAKVGGSCKKYDNERIYRMRLVMAVKAATN